jgi:hypothetical protein
MNGKVVRILHKDYQGHPLEIVVDVGEKDGVTPRTEFLIYKLGEEIEDPDGGESLGRLELVRGRGKSKHIQSRLTTVVPITRTKKKIRRTSGDLYVRPIESVEEEEEVLPFDKSLAVGDLVRILSK